MKKSILVLVIASVFASACSSYTCPTYAKKTDKKELKEQTNESERI